MHDTTALELAAISLACAAHDRIDTLLLGRPDAARKRVNRLLGLAEDAPQAAAVVPIALTPADIAAVAHGERVSARVGAFLSLAA